MSLQLKTKKLPPGPYIGKAVRNPETGFKPHDRQLQAFNMLAGPERFMMLVGGSRSAKTFTFCYAIMARAIRAPHSYHAILRFRANAARSSIWLDTLPKVQRLCYPQIPLIERNRDGFMELPNESRIWVGGLDDQERVEKILGQEHATIFLNECSQISYSAATVALTRLAQKVPGLSQRAYFDLNPTGMSHWTSKLFLEHVDPISKRPLGNAHQYKYMYMNPTDNAENLTPEYLESLMNLPERQRRRFFEGKYTAEVDGALWTMEVLEQNRREREELPPLRRIVVAVDPSGASSKDDEGANEIGIVVAGLGEDRHAYVLADRSVRDSPAVWGSRAVNAYKEFRANAVIGESNFGGDMVAFVINTQDKSVFYKEVRASRGKTVRAEPVSALYAKGLVHHVGRFHELEDQMCGMSTNGFIGEGSPDRADALVWAITDLLVGDSGPVDVKADPEASSGIAVDNDAPWNLSNVGGF